MPQAKGVIRIDSDSTHGWQVRVYRHGKTYSKLFSDRKCGGREEAFKQAMAFRDELEEEVRALPEAEPGRRMIRHNKNNVTGVLGISRTYKRDRHGRRHEVYAVSWNPEPGQARGTSFSIAKYGDETAFKMACRLRFQKMKEIHGERFPYTSYLELFEEGRDHLVNIGGDGAPDALETTTTSTAGTATNSAPARTPVPESTSVSGQAAISA